MFPRPQSFVKLNKKYCSFVSFSTYSFPVSWFDTEAIMCVVKHDKCGIFQLVNIVWSGVDCHTQVYRLINIVKVSG
jgi:hypothetical protein